MTVFSKEKVLLLHQYIAAETGGSAGVRDEGLLESAVCSAEMQFADVEQYPSAEEKATRLCFSLTNNHAFTDGNKRIGVVVMLMTLRFIPAPPLRSSSRLRGYCGRRSSAPRRRA